MCTRWFLERICRYQLECGNIGLKEFILAYDNISHSMISQGALAEYSQVEILLRALQGEVRAEAVMNVKLYTRGPLKLKYNKL